MRAAVIPRRGPPEVIELREVSPPTLRRRDEVLLRVHATSVNPIDTYLRSGKVPLPLRADFIPGGDACGTVVAVGDGVRDLAVGDRVFGLRPYLGGRGCAAELALFRADHLARAPGGLGDAALAGIPLAGLTAHQALRGLAGLQPGERLLVHGGSGGVGSLAIQLGRALGAEVYATASPRNHDLCRRLGAAEVFDYHTAAYRDLRGLDVVFDTIGAYYRASLPLLRPRGGRLITTTVLGDSPELSFGNLLRHGIRRLVSVIRRPFGGLRAGSVRVRPDGPGIRELAELLGSGAIVPCVGPTFALAELAAAHRQSESRRTVGKIAIMVAAGELPSRPTGLD